MTAPMYTLLLLAVIFANLPFLTTRLFAVKPMARKHIGHHLIELAAGFALTASTSSAVGSRAPDRSSAIRNILGSPERAPCMILAINAVDPVTLVLPISFSDPSSSNALTFPACPSSFIGIVKAIFSSFFKSAFSRLAFPDAIPPLRPLFFASSVVRTGFKFFVPSLIYLTKSNSFLSQKRLDLFLVKIPHSFFMFGIFYGISHMQFSRFDVNILRIAAIFCHFRIAYLLAII